ncbi:MAG: response regulator [Deltaproteobacteria bacterium]|nr:response regulator [Deltaproteobacteria bacterium]
MGKHADIDHRIGQTAENRGNAWHGYRVLLADDDYEMRKLIAWSLNKQGYQVTECEDGNALMKKLGIAFPFESVQPFDLIISDIRMPGSTGLQALKNIRKFEDDTPMILITAFPDDETRKKAGQLGALAVFEKPFDVDTLVAEVRRILPPGLAGKWPSPNPALQHSAPLPFPVGITFRHSKGLEAINAFVRDMARGLNSFAEHIEQVHVVVEDLSPEAYRKHCYHIGVQVSIRGGKPIVVSHDTDQADSHENLYLGIRIAFGVTRRQLKHALGKRRAKRFTRRGPSRQEIVDECE